MSEIIPDIYWEIGLQGNDWGLEQLFLSQISEKTYCLRKEKQDYFLIVPATTESPARIADLNSNFKATRLLLYAQQDEVMEKVERILKVLSSQLWCIDMRLGKLSVKRIGYWDHGEHLRRVSIVEEIRILDHISVTAFDSSGQLKHRHPTDQLTQLRASSRTRGVMLRRLLLSATETLGYTFC